jgi:hypothetical protein
MPSTQRKLQLVAGLTALLSLALAVGCQGFFVDPQLTSITVGPQNVNIQQGSHINMAAVGNYDDGSTQTLTSGVFWSSSDIAVAPVSQAGIVNGTASGIATISASSSVITGSTTVTVSLTNVTAITIAPDNQNVALGGTTQYTCTATITGGPPVDVTSSVTWSVTDTLGGVASNISISNQTNPATVSVLSGAATGTYNVNASYATSNGTFTDTATLTVQ